MADRGPHLHPGPERGSRSATPSAAGGGIVQEIRATTAVDGVQIAWAKVGTGPPLVRAGHWLTHLQHDLASPVWRHWLADLGRSFSYYRYDHRACGMSEREPADLSFEACVADLEVVVDHAGLDRFDLIGTSQGGTVATAYAARHPERVRRIVYCGAYARGRARRGSVDRETEAALLRDLIRVGWGGANPAYRRVFTTLFAPDATPEDIAAIDEMQRVSQSAAGAVRLRETFDVVDVTDLLPRVTAPALVLHVRDDAMVPFEEGRRVAAGLADARLVPLPGRNHLLLADDPAWVTAVRAMEEFLGVVPPPTRDRPEPDAGLEALSAREREILALVAEGRSNAEIAAALVLSPRTIERHLTNAYDKLGLSGKAARAAAAARHARG